MMKLLKALRDLFYPPRCVLCGKLMDASDEPLCPACRDTLPDFTGPAAKVRFTSGGAVAFFYEDKLRDSFLRFKFKGSSHYAPVYGAWLASVIDANLSGKYDVATWVPVSTIRRLFRGYDQTELLCREAMRRLGTEPVRLLRKRVHTPPQSSFAHAEERRANVSNAFSVCADIPAGTRVLLIDDIVTTGATLSECARMLRMAGAVSVCYAAFAAPRNSRTKEERYGNQTDS